jgi:hypothetical protein
MGVPTGMVSWTMGAESVNARPLAAVHGRCGVDGEAVLGQAGEALRRELQAGEYVAGGAVMTSDPPRWAVAAFLASAVALMAAGLAGLSGAGHGPVAAGLAAACLVGAGIEFLPLPVLVAVTSQRLLCWRLSRLRRTPRLLVFAVPLAELRICEVPAGQICELHPVRDAGRQAHPAAGQPGRAKGLCQARRSARAHGRIREAGPALAVSSEVLKTSEHSLRRAGNARICRSGRSQSGRGR